MDARTRRLAEMGLESLMRSQLARDPLTLPGVSLYRVEVRDDGVCAVTLERRGDGLLDTDFVTIEDDGTAGFEPDLSARLTAQHGPEVRRRFFAFPKL